MTGGSPKAPPIREISTELAQKHLETVFDQVEAGQEFWITRNDEQIARLIPLTASERKVFAEEAAPSVPPENR